MSEMTLSEELSWRGFVNQTTFKDVKVLDGSPITFYWGVDPSASSMTIGNLAAAMMVRHFLSHGHKAVLLVGGATGMIGDPDGKSDERNLMSTEDIQQNKKAIAKQYQQLFGGQDFTLVDNYDWFKDMGYLQFLRDVGKHVPMRQMLARDFVQNRLGEGGAGISYAEFSYVLIQAYDFFWLNREMGVTLQLCGSDQWGNSIAGVDLIRRLTGNETHVWSSPLVINKSTGAKFGKTEAGAIWLDPNLTSAYKFYQFWLNVDDAVVEEYLKIYTLLPRPKLENIMAEFQKNPQERLAQKTLAYEVTKLVHGEEAASSVQRITSVLFSGASLHTINSQDLEQLKSELPTIRKIAGAPVTEAIVATGLAVSTSEARRLVEQGGIYMNNKKINPNTTFTLEDREIMESALLRRGKNIFALVDIAES